MRRKPPEFRFEEEAAVERARLIVGQEVPITMRYCLGPRPTLLGIDGDFARLEFPNGAVLEKVPLRDLVDDSGYWKR